MKHKVLTPSTMLHRLVLLIVWFINPISVRYTVQTGTGKVDPARNFKFATAACKDNGCFLISVLRIECTLTLYSFLVEKQKYISRWWSDKELKGTVVNMTSQLKWRHAVPFENLMFLFFIGPSVIKRKNNFLVHLIL